MKLPNKTSMLIAGMALLISMQVFVSFKVFSQIDEAADERKQTFMRIALANKLQSELLDAETGQRGYILSGDASYLQPYSAVKDSISGHLADLFRLTKDHAATAHLEAMVPLIDDEMSKIAVIIEYYRTHRTTAGLILEGSTPKQLMDHIRVQILGYIQIEETAYARNDADFQSSMQRLLAVIFSITIMMLLFAILFAYFIYQNAQHRLNKSVYLETQHLLKVQEETNAKLEKTNADLQTSEEKLSVTLNSIGDAVMATDAEGNVTLLNPRAELITGWKLAEAAGRPVEEIFRIISEETRQPAVLPVRETLKNGTVLGLSEHILLVTRDGSECSIDDSCAPIRGLDGLVVGSVLVFRDITKRREVEAGLEKAHEELVDLAASLKHADQVKSEFLANMSHELRTPLNSINGFSEVLFDETFGTLNPKQKAYVTNVLSSGKHLLLLVNQILDMARVESGKMTLSLSRVSMKSVLNDISRLVEDMVGKKNLQMFLEIDENIPEIDADELKIKEVLYNLLSNAIKFTPDGAKIGMRARAADSGIEIEIWDTGLGIAPENMDKIFEGFFRVDTPYSWITEGTGLGLPLSKKLIELHRGVLTVESEGLHRGTTVRFTLPGAGVKEVGDE